MNFTPIDAFGKVKGICLVTAVEKRKSQKNEANVFLDIVLSDKSGKINAKLWNYSEKKYGEIMPSDVVEVVGTVSEYRGNEQLVLESIKKVTDESSIKCDDLVSTAEYSSEKMFNELLNIANGFSDEELKKLVTGILLEIKEPLLYWPAAMRMHHAMRGGLLFHTLSVVRLCEGIASVYPFVNRELLLSGAILHDIAKISEFEVGITGLATAYSVKGNLLGHLAEGAVSVRIFAKNNGISEETANLVEHMLLSHHGNPEFGAAVMPMFIEAQILSVADNLDAAVFEINEATKAVKPGEFTNKLFALENRKFYNHGKYCFDKKTKLF